MARSRQFAHVVLNYSNSSLALIALLLAEGQERAENDVSNLLRAFGPCIQQIRIATEDEWLQKHHQLELNTSKNQDHSKAEGWA